MLSSWLPPPLGNGMEEQEGEGRIQKAEEEKGNERRRRRERERGLFAEDVCTSASSSSSSLCLSSPVWLPSPHKMGGVVRPRKFFASLLCKIEWAQHFGIGCPQQMISPCAGRANFF